MSNKPKVAFIYVHNSCRSQIAEALGKHFAGDVFESFFAGTETKPRINQDTVRLMKELYDIDIEKTQYSKLLNEIPSVDIVIAIGSTIFISGTASSLWNWTASKPISLNFATFLSKAIAGHL
jgi:arsenate reductase